MATFNTNTLRTLVCASSLALLAGCMNAQTNHSSKVLENGVAKYAASQGIANQLVVRGDLEGLRVDDLRAQQSNGFLTVQAEVVNTTNRKRRLFYRFRWLDDSGMQVGADENWKPLQFMGVQSQMIRGAAKHPRASDFRIEMNADKK